MTRTRTRRSVPRLFGFTFPVTGVLLATVLGVAGTSAVYAQDAASAAQPAAPAAQAAAAATAPPDGSSGATPSSAGTSKPAPVCFKLTGRCVEKPPSGQAAATKGADTAKNGPANKRPLNLTAPDVSTVVSAEELKEPLPTNEQIVETQEDQTVSVKGDKGVPTDVPMGFGALWWALNHPSQAWRIVTPSE